MLLGELEKRPKCQEQLEVFKQSLWAHAATVITKKVLTSFDVTTLGSDDDIKEICNLLLRSCQS